jgi:uncharacterized protein (TIGR02246 family)
MIGHEYNTDDQRDPVRNWEADNYDLDRRLLAAMNSKDVDGAMSCFHDSSDLVVVLWATEMRGSAQVRAAMTKLFESYDQVKLDIDRVTEFPSGDAVIAVGQATYALTKSGQTTRISEVWTDVRRKVNGSWVFVLDHAEILPAK